MSVVGLDLSLTDTGVAIVSPRGSAAGFRVRSKAQEKPTIADRRDRLRALADTVLRRALPADLVVVEQPAYSRAQGSAHDRSGLWWLVTDALLELGARVVEVTPQQVKMYATGSGGAGKDEVLAAVVRRYPDVEVSNNNEADALVLAAMGARHEGYPLEESLPKANLRAMDKVRWT